MERWTGRVALVTGASAGIGAAIAYQLQDQGVHVVAVARRVDKIEGAVTNARKAAKTRGRYHAPKVVPGKLYAKKCDVSREEEILNVFKWIKEVLGGVDILVNNAAIIKDATISEISTEDFKSHLDVNILGLSICTREAVQSMRARRVDDGHIVHIASVAAHRVSRPAFVAYSATKHAVLALAEGLRKDFVEHRSKMKISVVSPGIVDTDIFNDLKSIGRAIYSENPFLHCEDVADAVLYALGAPPHVQIHEILLRPVGELK